MNNDNLKSLIQMYHRLKQFLIRVCPILLTIKAIFVAFKDACLPSKSTYSQSGEDTFILSSLQNKNISECRYVDVGANHPSRLSNTYLFYRRGASGLVLDPNKQLLLLHRWIRRHDTQLSLGCGDQPGLLKFQVAEAHVLSGFSHQNKKAKKIRKEFLVPVLPLDIILKPFELREITILSIDVEGFDLNVAKGAENTLSKTKFVIIEGNSSDGELVNFFVSRSFHLVHETKHNIIFENQSTN